jgi:hypothetical protein
MDNSTRLRIRRDGANCEVMVLVRHAMRARLIEKLALRCNGRPFAEIYSGENVAENPLFTVAVSGIEAGDTLQASWRDSSGAAGEARLVAG